MDGLKAFSAVVGINLFFVILYAGIMSLSP